jgi:hypothetical protein
MIPDETDRLQVQVSPLTLEGCHLVLASDRPDALRSLGQAARYRRNGVIVGLG